uniref:Uncharacterized protein n=1 Tax=viral metagenome TaxID=1070528 RepID=A0A6C0DUS1_9ZZZZ
MPKIKDIDVLNKFNLLENKIDIINTSLNLKKYILNDFFNYINFKNYIQDCFSKLKNEIISLVKDQGQSDNELVSKINSIFSEYIEYMFVNVDEKFKTCYDDDIYIYESVKATENKINNIYFENQIIKHQLQLGERLYNLEESLNSLQKIVKLKIDEIDKIKNNII